MRFDNDSVRNGMFVMGTQGERIGKVIRCNDETFVVEKGVFFPKDYELRYDHITDVTGGTIRYALTDFLRGRTPEEAKSARIGDGRRPCAGRRGDCSRDDRDTAGGGRPTGTGTRSGSRSCARRSASRRSRANRDTCGSTRRSSPRRSASPYRSRVKRSIIEHVAIGRDAALTGDDAFSEDTVDVPLYEEEVRVSKHPILEEEVVVRTVAHSVEREGSAMLRHEEAEIEDTRKSPGLSPSGDGLRLRGSGHPPLTGTGRNRGQVAGREQLGRRNMEMSLGRRSIAEMVGTFWLVLGGCGSAVLAANFPGLGIGFAGVALAFGLSVLTMAYALGGVSGAHFNPAVSVGLWRGRPLPRA